MTILLFASYKMKLKDDKGTWQEGSVNCTLVLENSSDYSSYMKELEEMLKTIHGASVVVLQNINTIKWETNAPN